MAALAMRGVIVLTALRWLRAEKLHVSGDASSLLALPSGSPRLLQSPCNDSSDSVKVYVMMSLTMVSRNGTLNDPEGLRQNLTKVKATGAAGVMTDVWWGITEPKPKQYNFAPYKQFFQMCQELELEVQIVTSFHQCCNEGDDCFIPLPSFVRQQPGIWFKNTLGNETRAYISLFADDVVVGDRTPKQMYTDWIEEFQKQFRHAMGTLIVEVMLGMGTDGELKYPSYQNPPTAWVYPGIGMFQASDQYALSSLQKAASAAGNPAWGIPPSLASTGNYNSFPNETAFFRDLGEYQTDYGKFFLKWYSQALINHGSTLLHMARSILGEHVKISGKIAGVHWWYKTASHAAELNAGFYNANDVNGYGLIAESFTGSNGVVDFTCLEMTDASQDPAYQCGPQELVQQVMRATENAGLNFTGENALGFYDAAGYNQMVSYKPPAGYLDSVTYLRISDKFLEAKHLETFSSFVAQMQSPSYVTPFTIL
mmetsp:Transcript_15480/g.27153  ORF Transcript_15480/g.27153 Transcript_15480/m.27153 type:complete len:482 (+) Transcript_15480:36-1481(+)